MTRTRTTASLSILLILLVAAEPGSAEELVDDPENRPLVRSPAAAGTPASDDDDGIILDPENARPGNADASGTNPGDGEILDPENSGALAPRPNTTVSPSAPTASSPGGPLLGPGFIRTEWRSSAAVDLTHDNGQEDTVQLVQSLDMRFRRPITERWTIHGGGRLAWTLEGGAADPDVPPFWPDADRWNGRYEADLRSLYFSGRHGDFLFRLGEQVIVWGSSDITRPADVINPVDMRQGLLASADDRRLPVLAADVTWVGDGWTASGVFVPFFRPNRVAVFGSDTALLRPGSPLDAAFPVSGAFRALIDRSVDDVVQPALVQTELPDETLENVSGGVRLTRSFPGTDVSASVFHGWDRLPTIDIDPRLVDALGAIGRGALQSGALGPLEVLAIQRAALALQQGETLFRSAHDRQTTLALDGVTYVGPVGIRAEAAYTPARTLYTESLRSIRRPTLQSALGASWESDGGELVLTVEGFHFHAFRETGDGRLALVQGDYGGVAGALLLDLGYFASLAETDWSDVTIRIAGFGVPTGGDWAVAPEVRWSLTSALEASLTATIVGSTDDGRETLGDVYRDNSQIAASLRGTF